MSILRKSCFHSRGHIQVQSSINLLRMFVLIISGSSLIMGQVGSKRRSLVQILEKSCLHSRGNIFCPIFLKIGQNVCIDNIMVKFDHGQSWVQIQVTRSNLRKNLFTLQGPQFLVQSSSNMVRMFVLIISQSSSIKGCVGSKSRSSGQILEGILFTLQGPTFLSNLPQSWSECLF